MRGQHVCSQTLMPDLPTDCKSMHHCQTQVTFLTAVINTVIPPQREKQETLWSRSSQIRLCSNVKGTLDLETNVLQTHFIFSYAGKKCRLAANTHIKPLCSLRLIFFFFFYILPLALAAHFYLLGCVFSGG